jgi:hypothetical protein
LVAAEVFTVVTVAEVFTVVTVAEVFTLVTVAEVFTLVAAEVFTVVTVAEVFAVVTVTEVFTLVTAFYRLTTFGGRIGILRFVLCQQKGCSKTECTKKNKPTKVCGYVFHRLIF